MIVRIVALCAIGLAIYVGYQEIYGTGMRWPTADAMSTAIGGVASGAGSLATGIAGALDGMIGK